MDWLCLWHLILDKQTGIKPRLCHTQPSWGIQSYLWIVVKFFFLIAEVHHLYIFPELRCLKPWISEDVVGGGIEVCGEERGVRCVVVRGAGTVRLYFTCYAYWHRQHRAARPPRPPAWPASPPPPPPTSTKHAEYSANFIGLFSNYGPDKPNPVLWTFKLGQSSVASHTEYLNIHVQTRLRLLLSSFNWSKFQTKKKLALLINQLK